MGGAIGLLTREHGKAKQSKTKKKRNKRERGKKGERGKETKSTKETSRRFVDDEDGGRSTSVSETRWRWEALTQLLVSRQCCPAMREDPSSGHWMGRF